MSGRRTEQKPKPPSHAATGGYPHVYGEQRDAEKRGEEGFGRRANCPHPALATTARAEGLVGGDGDAVLLLAFGRGPGEEFGNVGAEFHVAKFVDAGEVGSARP